MFQTTGFVDSEGRKEHPNLVLIWEIRVKTTLSRMGPAKLEHDYELFRDEILLAEAHSVLACVDREGAGLRSPEIVSRGI